MKRLAITLAVFLAVSVANAAEQQVRIEVGELSCPSCPYIAASALESVDSVEILEVDYDASAQMAVYTLSYDDAVTTAEAIADTTMEYGYPSRVLGAIPES